MKKSLLILISFLITGSVICQTKKERVRFHIKSVTAFQTDYKEGNPVTWKESYEEFDRSGNIVLLVEYGRDGKVDRKEKTKYNGRQDITEMIEYDSSGQVVKITRFTYTSNGDKSMEKVTDTSGKILKQIDYDYDSRNLKICKTTLGKTREPRSKKKWVYDYF